MSNWEYKNFTDAILQLTSIDLASYNERQMKRRINSFMSRNKYQNYHDFYQAVVIDKEIRNKFINFITINVTEFFRNPAQWDKLKIDIIPKWTELRQPMKIWSSACSTGEEPYSLVMLLNQFMDLDSIKVLATDIDDGAIAKAQQGVYTSKNLKNIPDEYIFKYFDYKDDEYYIKDRVKKCVEFKKLNLLADPYPQRCNLILCRNVMIYFTMDVKEQMYKRFYDSLLPGGVLFLGNTEQIISPGQYGLTSLKSFFYSKV